MMASHQSGEDHNKTSRNNMAGVSPTGYYYSDQHHHHQMNQLQQSFDHHQSNPSAEIYNLTTGMEMIGFFGQKPGNPSPSTVGPSSYIPQDATSWHHDDGDGQDDDDQNRLMVDDSNLRSCVFPCEGNERPSQGLSLSLSSNNPSSIGLQSFELRQQPPPPPPTQDDHDMRFRDGLFGKSASFQQNQNLLIDGLMGKSGNFHDHDHHQESQMYQIRNSKYLGPTQELLNEFCNLDGGTTNQSDPPKKMMRPHKTNQWQQDHDHQNHPSSSSSSKNTSNLYSLDFLELQRRKSKLLSMIEEVDRRYRHYCDQMKAVVSTFEAVAGHGSARAYSALASKAMSKHFRCLRDGIVSQIKEVKKAMGEKETISPGTTRGETPRLRLLDQTLRHQRASQQMSMLESHPWRPQRGLPERSVSVLRAWLFEHFLHPYPSDVDKHILARQTGLSRSQVSNWFINARVRLWKPMVEEMYVEETREQDNNNMVSSDGLITAVDHELSRPSLTRPDHQDQKPTSDQLVRIDSECLSSIINQQEKNDPKSTHNAPQNHQPHNFGHPHQHGFGRISDAFGAVELDFSGGVSYPNDQSFSGAGGGGGVSLTLGLQQHGDSGVSMAFSQGSQSSLFYPRDHIEDCQTVQYSLLDSEGQNLPYRNLMGAQLLHDLAG